MQETDFDTHLPLNINDEDLSPEMADPPMECEGATGITFTLIRCEVAQVVRRLASLELLSEDQEMVVREFEQHLEERYIRHCDQSVPILRVSASLARLLVARMWIIIHHTMEQKWSTMPSESMQEHLFLMATEVVERSANMITDSETQNWSWFFKTQLNFNAVAMILSQISLGRPVPNYDRAWKYVTAVYNWLQQQDGNRKVLFTKPMKRIMTKACCTNRIKSHESSSYDTEGPSPLPVTVDNRTHSHAEALQEDTGTSDFQQHSPVSTLSPFEQGFTGYNFGRLASQVASDHEECPWLNRNIPCEENLNMDLGYQAVASMMDGDLDAANNPHSILEAQLDEIFWSLQSPTGEGKT